MVLGKSLLVGVRALGGVGNAVLGLPVLGQVEGGYLLGFLNLLLVRLYLALELVDQGLHPLVVLAVLVLLVAQLIFRSDLHMFFWASSMRLFSAWASKILGSLSRP